jgi:site-specific DNA-methyltransferase (adenine-specific)
LGTFVDQILKGDCLKVLPELPSETYNLIVCSPPYAYNRRATYGGIPVNEYVEWFLPISRQLKRVLKPRGSFILNIKERVIDGERGTYVYDLVLAMRKQGWRWTEEYIWHKKNSYPGWWPNRLRDNWERCYHFTKKRKFDMYHNHVKEKMGDWASKRLQNLGKNDRIKRMSNTKSPFTMKLTNYVGKKYVLPDNVLYLATESRNQNHSATYPVALPSFFIKLFTMKGDIVLDPFVGSGTTAVAAVQLGRHFTGIEVNDDYHKVALERLAKLRGEMQVAPISTHRGRTPIE